MGDALLVADIGGTNARFALADPHAASPLLVASVREFPVAAFPSLAEAAAHYLDQVGTRARRGVFAVAGRIDGDQARITNHPWVISRSRTREMLGFDQVHLLNDFAAQAMAISLYRPEDLVAIDAAGDREHAAVGVRAGLVQVVARGIGQRREVGDRELAHAVVQQRRRRVRVGKGEAGVGTADVGDQQRGGHGQVPRLAGRPTASNSAGR